MWSPGTPQGLVTSQGCFPQLDQLFAESRFLLPNPGSPGCGLLLRVGTDALLGFLSSVASSHPVLM